LLRRHVAAGRYGHSMGAGFFQHDA
jgi:hypothetical protein